ncbi:putative inorganic phosphate cotransporter isoform X2 [Agrilus planipennis]|uniref:Inorganic phosphate cotransporter isoform X2 n=1 Tax=Agrilus planipennis TaxID=224129 RepID=A0A1W4XA43_AGRPL|nr:putative inorganic phosphate cotransporter isoform X2 [Agrilus planipennis]
MNLIQDATIKEVYDWDNQGTILSSFLWGYCVSQVVTGYFADRFGSYWILMISMGCNSVLSIIIPFITQYGSNAVIVCRLFQGISQGPLFPCIQFLLGKWTPIKERARFVAVTQSGIQLGCIFTVAFSGWISSTRLGWPWSFYITGILSFIWTIFWTFLGSNNPYTHKKITELEIKYITDNVNEEDEVKTKTIPWKHIIRSLPLLTLIAFSMLNEFGFAMFTNDIPLYMSSVLKFDIDKNGFLSALPYAVNFVIHFLNGSFFDWIINKKYVSLEMGRKISGSLGASGSAIACIVLGFLTSNQVNLAVVFVILGYAIHAPAGSLIFTNLLDIAPRYNGTLMGVINTCANLFASLAPLSVQWIVTDKSDVAQWAVVFFLMAGFQVFSTILLICFASGEVQYWNYIENEKERSNDRDNK